jgi:hypothetical protein
MIFIIKKFCEKKPERLFSLVYNVKIGLFLHYKCSFCFRVVFFFVFVFQVPGYSSVTSITTPFLESLSFPEVLVVNLFLINYEYRFFNSNFSIIGYLWIIIFMMNFKI